MCIMSYIPVVTVNMLLVTAFANREQDIAEEDSSNASETLNEIVQPTKGLVVRLLSSIAKCLGHEVLIVENIEK